MLRPGDLADGVRLAFRNLLRQPTFAVTALAILALGVGANTAIFSVVRTVLLKPLPYHEPGRLYIFWTRNLEQNQPRAHFSAPEFVDYQREIKSFSGLVAYRNFSATLTGHGEAQRVMTCIATPNYFTVLGVQPVFGRGFVPEEGIFGRNQSVILGYRFWQARLGGDPGVLGRTLMLDDEPHEVVGVLPELQGEVRTPDMFLPAAFSPQELGTRSAKYLTVMGRLADGVTPAQAEQELAAVAARLAGLNPEARGWDAWIVSARAEFTKDARQPLLVLFVAVGMVLLIACGNLAGLLLVRATARGREFAVRAALGAGRLHLILQMLAEALTLAVLGGLAGLAVAKLGLGILVNVTSVNFPRLREAELDPPALLFNFAAALAAGILFGAAPALRAMRVNLAGALREETRGGSGSLRQSIGRSLLVVSEVAFSTILLVGAGLLARTFDKLSAVDPGFNPKGVLTMRTTLPYARYETPESRAGYVRRVLEELHSLPGVQAAGLTTALPLMGVNWRAEVLVDGSAEGKPELITYNAISPGYLAASGTKLRSGRDLSWADTGDAAPVVLISEAVEKALFQGRNPLGRRLRMKVANFEVDAQIAGVVQDVRHLTLDEEPRMAVYQPHAQLPWPFLAFAVKTSADPMAQAGAIRRVFHNVDSALPVDRVQPLSALVDQVLSQHRLAMNLLWIFSVMAVVLAAVGLYGVLAAAAVQRTREFGIRLALGAGRGNIVRLVLTQGLALTLTGLLAGLAIAPLAAGALEQMLFGVGRVDAATYAGVAVLLILVTVSACLPPALRASRTDPATALRSE
jgi:putative ABC transport system permease protein